MQKSLMAAMLVLPLLAAGNVRAQDAAGVSLDKAQAALDAAATKKEAFKKDLEAQKAEQEAKKEALKKDVEAKKAEKKAAKEEAKAKKKAQKAEAKAKRQKLKDDLKSTMSW